MMPNGSDAWEADPGLDPDPDLHVGASPTESVWIFIIGEQLMLALIWN